MTVTTEYIGKEQAALYLQCNREPEIGVKGTNRRSGVTVVDGYKTEMLEGRWKLNPHGIIFDTEGWLIDGAQRMKAVVAAGRINPEIVVAFRVTRNASPDVMMVIDLGRKRAPGDFLVMNGFRSTKVMASTIKLITVYDINWRLDQINTWRVLNIAPAVLIEFAEKNPYIEEAVRHGCYASKAMKPSAVAAGLFLTSRDRPDLDNFTFYEQVMSGVRLEAHDPAYALREHIAKQRQIHRKYEVHEELALYIKGYNLWAQDKPAAAVRYMRTENFPRILTTPKVS